MQNELHEWYRVQYNIPVKDFENANIDHFDIVRDFYRRQYFNEIRLGVRNSDNTNVEFMMPPFTVFRPFGGAMPVPNGFNVENDFTTKKDNYRLGSADSSSSPPSSTTSSYNSSNSSSTRHISSSGWTEHNEYEMDSKEFDTAVASIDEGNEDVWEELERLSPAGE